MKPRGRRSEADDGERNELVYWGRGRVFLEMGCHPLSILFWSPSSSHGHQYVCHPVADVVKSACDETEGLLEDRFIATLVPAGSICFCFCFVFVSLYSFLLLSPDPVT